MDNPLIEWINSNIYKLSEIKQSNEIGDCEQIMNNIFSELYQDFKVKKMCIYSGDDIGYIDVVTLYNVSHKLAELETIENNKTIHDYVIHYVPVVDGYVIDLNKPEEIKDISDFLFEINEYKSMFKNMNKNKEINFIYDK